MTDPAFLSRLTLRRDAAAVAPLISVLAPEHPDEAAAMTHRLMWAAMPRDLQDRRTAASAGGAHPTTPFLWRAEGTGGRFYLLGPRPNEDCPFFEVETRPFEPLFAAGDRLAFDLRANATVDRKVGQSADGIPIRMRSDVAMDFMHAEERNAGPGESLPARAARRGPGAQSAAAAWLATQGEKYGFALEALSLEGYRVMQLPRRGKSASIGVFDLKGIVVVHEPVQFVDRLMRGFGRAKAFGCGLMLVRRVR